MKKYLLIGITCCIFFSSKLIAQIPGLPNSERSSYINLQKYWWYRYRLVNDFTKIGWNCGESIPAQRRDSSSGTHLSRLEWGDATIDLGNYIAMLATEHRLLANNGLGTERSDMELFFALNAFERLDRNAEIYCRDIDGTYPCIAQGDNLNGFFIRDDVPFTTFGENTWGTANPKSHFNTPGIINHIPQRDGLVDGAFNGRTNVPALSITAPWTHHVRRMPTEESLDQTIQLAMGFALASKLTSGNAFYSPFGTPIDLGSMAADNLHRMVEYPSLHNWKIKNPVTNECVYGIVPETPSCSNGGALYFAMAYGASRACNAWGKGGFSTSFVLNTVWQATQIMASFKDANFAATYAALTPRSWRGLLGKDQTWKRMRQFATAHNNRFPHLPYLYRVMTGNGEAFRIGETIDLLDAAPGCGIHNYYGEFANEKNPFTGKYEHNSHIAWNWSGNDLIHEPQHRADRFLGIYIPSNFYRDHNGLDYMVLFNLFNLQCTPDGIYTPYYFNSYYKENFNMSFPTTSLFPSYSGILGDNVNKLKLNFLEYLSTSSKINNGGNLTLRGAKVIDLLPGFETRGNSYFLGYVKDYDINCGQYLGKDEYGNDKGIAGENYYYAEVTGPKSTWRTQSNFLSGTNSSNDDDDTTVVLDFPPDGVPYNPDSSIHSGNEPIDSLTCEQEHAYFDSLVNAIYASGDQEQIDYLDSVIIPNASFPACDTDNNGNQEAQNKAAGTSNNVMNIKPEMFSVYPNPSTGRFTFVFSTPGEYDINVFDATGRQVYKTHIYNRKSEVIHLGELTSGIYTALVQPSGQQVKQAKKLIISH